MRRPLDTRVTAALTRVDERLAEIADRISAAADRPEEHPFGLSNAIGATIDLDEVLQRALAAAEALPAVDGSFITVERPNGQRTTAVNGLAVEGGMALTGPPDGSPFVAGHSSWESDAPGGLRTGLVVPLATEGGGGALSVYSRLPDAFDGEAVGVLAAIARQAVPAVHNAFRYLDVQELAATDLRTGVGSANAFEEALPREISAARRHGRPLSLIQIDLDDFGRINRDYSQATGDAVLSEFGERVRATIRGSDSAFRNSGGADEFFLILPDTTQQLAKLLYGRLAFEVAARSFGEVESLTMSGGLVELRSDDTAATLKARADTIVKVAKETKNRLCTDADGP